MRSTTRAALGRHSVNLAAVATVIASIGVLLVGCGLPLLTPKNWHAQLYADHMTVRDGYSRIDDYNGGQGSCGCDLERWYIGPTGIAATAIFSGPGLSLHPESYPIDDHLWLWLLDGTGTAADSGSCNVSVDLLRRAAGLYLYPDIWHLSRQQIDGWNAGRLDIYRLSFGCERDGL